HRSSRAVSSGRSTRTAYVSPSSTTQLRVRPCFICTSTSFPATRTKRCERIHARWLIPPCSKLTQRESRPRWNRVPRRERQRYRPRSRPTNIKNEGGPITTMTIFKVPEDFAALAHLRHADYQR